MHEMFFTYTNVMYKEPSTLLILNPASRKVHTGTYVFAKYKNHTHALGHALSKKEPGLTH